MGILPENALETIPDLMFLLANTYELFRIDGF